MSFWRPGAVAPGSSLDRVSEAEAVITASPLQSSSPYDQRTRLPIYKHRDKLLYSIETYGVVIIVGQTGCGKTTQLPQFLYEAGWAANGRVVACTQPRRVAATSVASRVAAEIGTSLGKEVGYTIRFEDLSDKEQTRILYLTDGMLFRELLVDPLLSRYSVIMVDEVHERSVYTDLLLGMLKKIRRKRPELRIIVSSATMDANYFLNYFTNDTSNDEAAIISLEGRMYPVQVAYMDDPIPDYVQSAAQIAWNINLQRRPGDILVFLTGREDIDRCLDELAERMPLLPLGASRPSLVPLHAGLTNDEQLKAFLPAEKGMRKIILSTNIAEASVTIEGIRFVIDSGFVKIRVYNPTAAMSSLVVVPTSKAAATQRAGRAGRTSNGVCYRLYSKSAFDALPSTTPPEIGRTDLTSLILQLKALGVDDLMKFPWVTPPPAESVLRALEALSASALITDGGHLTHVGSKIAECPIEHNIAKMLFASEGFQCGDEILSIAAMISVQNVFVIPDGAAGAVAELERRKFTAEEGDHLTLLNAFNAFVRYGQASSWCKSHALSFRAMSRAVSIRAQLKKYMVRFNLPIKSCEGDAKRLRQCLVSGYWQNSAKLQPDQTYHSTHGNKTLHIHPSSVLFNRQGRPKWILFHEITETTQTQVNILTEIDPDWLMDYGYKYTLQHSTSL
ncbi:pre-mRNA splicing factor [Coprinopsis sp. MPI-PUGE-AT-0042]|nr:pre-mRNA splicing factor [Coprinopsis sp. MPI-PUGE-AT-0042]